MYNLKIKRDILQSAVITIETTINININIQSLPLDVLSLTKTFLLSIE